MAAPTMVLAQDQPNQNTDSYQNGSAARVEACVAPEMRIKALEVAAVSAAPAELCAPTYQIIEIRNQARTPLRDVQVLFAPPLGPKAFSFAAPVFEISSDDGATWVRIDPPVGSGTNQDPFAWTPEQTLALSRLGKSGGVDDSVLLRWRARFGEAFGRRVAAGDGAEADARISFGATANDVCGNAVYTPLRATSLPILQPRVAAALTGRNVTRGGEFSATVPAAPGDEIDWRLEVENVGAAMAREVRARLTGGGQPIGALEPVGAVDLSPEGVAALQNLVETGRRTVRLRERVGPGCGRRETVAETSWGCAEPGDGALSALRDLRAGVASATLSTRPRAEDIALEQRMLGVDGAARPGERAEIRLTLTNGGAPLFEPKFSVVLPDGYEFDASHPVELFAPGVGVAGVDVSGGRPTTPVLALLGRNGSPAEINPDETLSLTYRARRVRRAASAQDEIVTTVSFRDGCGDVGGAPAVRTQVTPRQASLALMVESIGDPLVSGAGETRRFRAVARNVGEETARRLALRLIAGAGWAPTPPEGCVREASSAGESGAVGGAPGGATSFLCAMPGPATPGRAVEREFEMTVAGAPDPTEAAETATGVAVEGDAETSPEAPSSKVPGDDGAASFNLTALEADALDAVGALSVTAVAMAAPDVIPAPGGQATTALELDALGDLADIAAGTVSPLALDETRFGVAGFRMSQHLLSAAGRELPADVVLDLGDQVVIEVSARWFGAGDEAIEAVSIAQGLPDALAFRGAEQIDGDFQVETLLTPDEAGGGRMLWSLGETRGGGSFVARVSAEVVDPRQAPGERSDGAGFAAAGAVFNLRGVSYGVDPLLDAPTRAAPIEMRFRRPDVRLGLEVISEAPGEEWPALVETPTGDEDRAPGPSNEAPFPARGGERLIAEIALDNTGDAPGFLDWLDLTAPEFITILPLESDGLDNDGDGEIDEAEEARFATRDPTGRRLRWLAVRDPIEAATPGAAQRLEVESRRRWLVALDVAPDVAPGSAAALRLETRYGSAPYSVAGAGSRRSDTLERWVRTPSVRGFLVVTGTSVGRDLSQQVTHGEEVEHRLSLRFPAGSLQDVVAEIAFPPSLTAAESLRYGMGAGIQCQGMQAPVYEPGRAEREEGGGEGEGLETGSLPENALSEAREAGGRLIWRLGDCRAALEAPEGERVALLDMVAVMRDVDPHAEAEARAAWRDGRVEARLRSNLRPEGVVIGRSSLSLGGPLLRAVMSLDMAEDVSASDDADQAARLDAGDGFQARLLLENVGDAPARDLKVAIQRPRGGGLNCGVLAPISLPKGFQATSVKPARPTEAALGVGQDDEPPSSGARPTGPGTASFRYCGDPLQRMSPPLKPGETVTIDFTGRLGVATALGSEIAAPVEVAALGPEGAMARVSDAKLRMLVAAPPAPTVEAASALGMRRAKPETAGGLGGGAEETASTPPAAIGDVFRLRARHAFPEGRGAAALTVRYRLRGARSGAVFAPFAAISQAPAPHPDALQPPISEAETPAALRLTGATLTRERDDLIAERNPGGVNAAAVGSSTAVVEAVIETVDADGWRRLTLPLGGVVSRRPSDGRDDGVYLFEATLALEDAAEASEGRVLEAQAVTELGDRQITGAPVDIARISEPFIELAASQASLVATDFTSVGPAASASRLAFRGVACNRGSAPAYGVRLRAEPPTHVALDAAHPARYVRLDASSALGPQRYGVVRVAGADGAAALFAEPSTDTAPLAPGECLELRAPLRLNPTAGSGPDGELMRFTAVRYQGRPSSERPGRIYGGGGAAARLEIPRLVLRAAALMDAPADRNAPSLYSFTIEAPRTDKPLRLRLQTASQQGLDWSLHRDVNGDGRLDGADPSWRDGYALQPGERLHMIARAVLPETTPVGWRDVVRLSALGIGGDGAALHGARELVLRRADARAGFVTARRLMAIDRNCDGALEDEITQDSVFSEGQDVAVGECVVMRLAFRNAGAASVEQVEVADRLFPGASFIPGSARFIATPAGLVAGGVRTPGSEIEALARAGVELSREPRSDPRRDDGAAAKDEISYRFVGSLSPGIEGIVEYRARLTGAP